MSSALTRLRLYRQPSQTCDHGNNRRQGKLWQRSFEQHCEYAYEPDELTAWLTEAGFVNIRQFGDRRLEAPTPQEQRIYFCAEKKEG